MQKLVFGVLAWNWMAVAGCTALWAEEPAKPQLRGIWAHADCLKTPAEADQWLARIERGRFNAVYLLVWYWGGQAAFQSQTPLCPMLEGVQPGHDPLGYMAQQCRRRKIELHAWFVNGAYGNPTVRHVLDRHPDWAVQNDDREHVWYDLGQPEVRKFQSDLMIGALTKYDLDGLHFDYIRYNGSAVCYCKRCQTEFAARYGLGPLEKPQGQAFPVAARFTGNPVAKPTTAQVLAEFSDATPAIATNTLGQGQVLLFNWHAFEPLLPATAETVKRTLRQWNAAPDKLFVFDTAPNRERYGRKRTENAVATLGKLGYQAKITPDDRLDKLPRGAVAVLPEVYLIPEEFAKALEQFVRSGGRLLVVDGPILSIRQTAIQRVIGMTGAAKYLNRLEVIRPVGKSPLVVSSGASLDIAKEKLRWEKWAEYRKWGVSELVRDVYRRAKQVKPKAQVTAAVFTPLASADSAFQDWPRWIREGTIDYVIPMAYTPKNAELDKQLREWTTVDSRLERIIPGLGIFTSSRVEETYTPRDASLIMAQYRMCMEMGARGTCFYSLDGTVVHPTLLLTDALIEVLCKGPFKDPASPYRPPEKKP